MEAVLPLDEIRSTATGIASDRLDKARIREILVKERTDHSGDLALSITIVFDKAPTKKALSENAPEIMRLIKQFLTRRGDERFPYLTFMLTEDLGSTETK